MSKYTCGKPNDNIRVNSVLNYGVFIANVYLDYIYKGKKFDIEKQGLAVLQEFKVYVPSEAINVNFSVTIDDIFEQYQLFNNYYPVVEDACFLLWGYSFTAQYKKIPCTGPGVIQSILPQGVIIPTQSVTNDVCTKCNCNYLGIDTESNINSLQNNNCNIERVRVEGKNIY